MSIEAAAGKNPVTYIGKIYNVLAQRISEDTVNSIPGVNSAHCLMVSRIGDPVNRPSVLHLSSRHVRDWQNQAAGGRHRGIKPQPAAEADRRVRGGHDHRFLGQQLTPGTPRVIPPPRLDPTRHREPSGCIAVCLPQWRRWTSPDQVQPYGQQDTKDALGSLVARASSRAVRFRDRPPASPSCPDRSIPGRWAQSDAALKVPLNGV